MASDKQQPVDDLVRELARLKAENERLTRELDDAKADAVHWSHEASTYAKRLDKARERERALAERAGGLLDPDMPAQEMRLHMGEMTAQEMRTARAAIRWANTRQAERVGGVKAQLEAALTKVEYQPGDHPVVPVKHDQFVKDVRRILSALTTEPAAPEDCLTCTGTGTVEDAKSEGPPSYGFLPCPDCSPAAPEGRQDNEPRAYIVHAPEDDYYGTGPDRLQIHPLAQHDMDNGYRQTPLYGRPAHELSGNTGELIDRMAAAIRDWGSHYDDGPWETLPEDRKAGWRGDAERALEVVKEYLTARRPAEQAVTEVMVEAAANSIANIWCTGDLKAIAREALKAAMEVGR